MDSHFSHLIIYTDGSMTPCGTGAGAVVLDAKENLLHLENKILKPMTNNEAEYAGLVLAFQLAATLFAEFVEIRADSEVMVYQMRGEYAVRSKSLLKLHWQACELARQFLRVRYLHIPREENALADALAAEASAGRHWSIGRS